MAIVVGLLVLQFLIFAFVLMRIVARHDAERESWTEERRELLNRIQRPERIERKPTLSKREPRETGELHKVGTVNLEGTRADG